MENIPLFHIWKTEGPGATGGHWVVRPVAIESSLTQYLISLAPLGLHFKVSVVLFHPVPAFITVLPVLFSFNNLSVAPTEEAHLSKKCERQRYECLRSDLNNLRFHMFGIINYKSLDNALHGCRVYSIVLVYGSEPLNRCHLS